MSFDFRKAGQAALSLSPLMVGKEKIDTLQVIGKELTIIEFDLVPSYDKEKKEVRRDSETGEVLTYAVGAFKEIPGGYYNFGFYGTKMCRTWAAGFNGDVAAASAALKEAGGVRVRLELERKSNGNNQVNIIFPDPEH